MTDPDKTDFAIILTEHESLMGEEADDVRRGVKAGLLVRCPHGRAVIGKRPFAAERLPCGFVHGFGGFFHIAPGRTLEDYLESR